MPAAADHASGQGQYRCAVRPHAAGEYSITYTVKATNTGAAATTYQLWDKAQYGPNIEVLGASWNGQRTGSATAAQIATAGHFELAPNATAIAANTSHTYNVTIRFKLNGTGYDPATCQPGNGLFNLAVVKDGATGPGFQDDDCLPPPNPPKATFAVEKGPRPGTAVAVGPNGNAELVYTVTVTNTSDTEGTTAAIEDRFWVPANVTPSTGARISVDDAAGVAGMPASWPVAQMQAAADPARPALKLADTVTLTPGASRTFTIRIPITVNVANADWGALGGPGGSFTGGAPNTVFMADDTSANNNDACIPLTKPELASLTINKVDIDNQMVPLDGAQFALYPAAADGTFNPAAPPVAGPTGTPPKWENLAPGRYFLVETKSPQGYQPLPKPVGITIGATNVAYGVGIDDADVTVATDSIDLVVQVNDIKTGNLPLTGPRDQAFWYALALMVGLGMVALNLGLFRRDFN